MSEPTDRHYRLRERRRVARNARFDVFFDWLDGPQGTAIPEFLMVRPQVMHGIIGGVCVLPEMGGRIGLMRSHRYQFDEAVWQAPAGFLEPDEPPAATALRELAEETGLVCPPGQLESLGELVPDAGLIECKVALYLARGCGSGDGGPIEMEPGVGAVTWFEPPALAALVRRTGVMGASTLVACLRYLLDHSR